MKYEYDYFVGVYKNIKGNVGRKIDTAHYTRTSQTCGDEVLETANAFFTGDNTCRIDGIFILNNGQVVGVVDEKVA